MQTTSTRYFILTAVLLAGAALYAASGNPLGNGTPRWPTADTIYAADGWSVGPQQVDGTSTIQVTRELRSTTGAIVTLTIFSNQAPKLYGAGAEAPFLGDGYSVDQLRADLGSLTYDGIHGLIASRGTDEWLVMYAYGERRGLLGNGPSAWALALFDGMAGHPNDYYKLYLSARLDASQPDIGPSVAELATVLFPRIAAYYSAGVRNPL